MERNWRILDELETAPPHVAASIVKFLTPEEVRFIETYGSTELLIGLRNPFEKPVAIARAKKSYKDEIKLWKDLLEDRGFKGKDFEVAWEQKKREAYEEYQMELKKIEEEFAKK
jgi:hypothetical protein